MHTSRGLTSRVVHPQCAPSTPQTSVLSTRGRRAHIPGQAGNPPSRTSVVPQSVFSGVNAVPISVLTDSYKATHFLQYLLASLHLTRAARPASSWSQYGEFRSGYNKDKEDTRLVCYGIRYIIENYVSRQWTEADVELADAFYKTHMAPNFTSFPFPRDLFMKFVRENNGYFPIRVEALPEGTCAHVRVPVYQITATDEYTPLCTFLETLLTMVWYPSTVATLSRRVRDVVERSFARTSDQGSASPLVPSRLHDFGFRGCTSVEQSIVGGCAHLLNFMGSDTMSAAFYAQMHLNSGRPVGNSIPATEHSVMTAWPSEQAAMENMVQHFGAGAYSIVMDSYDYANALDVVLPAVAEKKKARGGFMVLRPDSGDPKEAVLMALRAADRAFGSQLNSKGFKVINGCGVIQGDGIDIETLRRITVAVEEAGFAADNVVYGMGGGLLQKVNRDTMSFATKLCHIVSQDGRAADVMKQPLTDSGKFSLPGDLAVKLVDGVPTVFPRADVAEGDNMLKVVYDRGPVPGVWDDFDTVRARVAEQWTKLPPKAHNLSPQIKAKIKQQLLARGKKAKA